MAAKHTPELWLVNKKAGTLYYLNPEIEGGANADVDPRHDSIIMTTQPEGFEPYMSGIEEDECEANLERAAACVNALAGLNPEVVADMVEALEFVANETRGECSMMATAVLTKARR